LATEVRKTQISNALISFKNSYSLIVLPKKKKNERKMNKNELKLRKKQEKKPKKIRLRQFHQQNGSREKNI